MSSPSSRRLTTMSFHQFFSSPLCFNTCKYTHWTLRPIAIYITNLIFSPCLKWCLHIPYHKHVSSLSLRIKLMLNFELQNVLHLFKQKIFYYFLSTITHYCMCLRISCFAFVSVISKKFDNLRNTKIPRQIPTVLVWLLWLWWW